MMVEIKTGESQSVAKVARGIDPGLAHLGWAEVRLGPFGYCFTLLGYGVLETKAREGTVASSNAERTLQLSQYLDACNISEGHGRYMHTVAERYEHLRNSMNASKLAAAHAVVVAKLGFVPKYVSPRSMKRAVTGCDVASKRVVERACARGVVGAREVFEQYRVSKRAGLVEHLADAMGIVIADLGFKQKPILLSTYPLTHDTKLAIENQISPPRKKCSLCKGRGRCVEVDSIEVNGKTTNPRSARCLCTSGPALEEAFDLLSLFPEEPTEDRSSVNGPAKRRAAAEALLPKLDGRAVIFLGNVVAKAFGVSPDEDPECAWFEVEEPRVSLKGEPTSVFMGALIPHLDPKLWKDAKTARARRSFLCSAARSAS